MAQRAGVPLFRAGAEDPLPSQYLWFEGDGYWIYAADQPRSSWREHTHECAQISVGLEACTRMEWRHNSQLPVRRQFCGTVVCVIPPGEPHRTLWERRASLVTIYLDKQLLPAPLEPAHLARDPLIEELGRALYWEYREHESHGLSKHFADAVVTVLTTHLLRSYNASAEARSDVAGGLGPAASRRVRKYIEESIEGDLSIEALARVSGLSPHYFAEGFRRTTGFTPHQYVSHRRVDRARQLLTQADLPLTEVANRCGFKSQSQFTTVFHRFTGVTPGKFRAGLAAPDTSAPAVRIGRTA